MQTLNVPVELINQIMGYLGTRPYQEVFQLINGITTVAQTQATPPDDSPKE